MTYLRLGLFVGALAACIAAFFYGVGVGKDRQAARYAKAEAALAKAVEANIAAAQANDLAAVEASTRRETIIREIVRDTPKIIERPVYRNICVDADGVRLLDRAVAAANGGDAPASGSDVDPARLRPAPDDD